MKQSNNYNFHVPHRQSLQAILVIAALNIVKWVRIFFPLLILWVVRSKELSLLWAFPLVFIALVLALGSAYLWYRKYTFYILGEKLVIEKGIFHKEKVDIPFERIQNVGFRQNLLQQILKVTGLTVETAGSKQSEASLVAIPMEMALELRQHLMQRKEQTRPTDSEEENKKILLQLNPSVLLKIGLSANHLGSALLLFFLGLSFTERIGEILGFDLYDNLSQVLLSLSLSIVLFILPLVLLVAVLYSLIRIYIKYFRLTVLKDKNHLLVSYGLTKRHEKSLIPSKIQIIRWKSNWIREKMGFGEISFSQASSEETRLNENIALPGCTPLQKRQILEELGMDSLQEDSGTELSHVDKKYYLRGLVFRGGIILLAAVGVIGLVSNFFYALLLGPSIGIAWYFWWGAYYKNLQYCVKDTYFTKVTGVYDISQIYFYWHKIQAIRVHTTPFMRRNNLVSIEFFTAGGSVKLPYIKESKARFIVNQAIYKVETSKLSWM